MGDMRRQLFVLFLVLVAMALAMRVWRPVHGGAETVGQTLDGLRPGMTRAQTERVLGVPDGRGPLDVAGGKGAWAEYGSHRLTWDGHPTVTFRPDETVLCVIGDHVLRGRQSVVSLGDDEGLVATALGIPSRDERNGDVHSMAYKDAAGTLQVLCRQGRVYRLLWYR